MKAIKNKLIHFIFMNLILCLMTTAFADNHSSIVFFASNNSHEIDAKTAYARLMGKEQLQLRNAIKSVMTSNNVKEEKTQEKLGMYQMNSDEKITSDNTELFYASESKALTKNKIFSIAKTVSNNLDQESVAVFIPSMQSKAGNVTVTFQQPKYTINDIIKTIREKCPSLYSDAYSLQLTKDNNGFNNAKVISIQWLGSKINPDDLKKAFPYETISVQKGDAYLVYKTGSINPI